MTLAQMLVVVKKRAEIRQNNAQASNDVYIPLFNNESRYLVLKGGGGSGKSIFAGMKILERIVNEPGHRILVVRKVAKTLRESCFQQLRGQISQLYNSNDFNIHKGDMYIRHKATGNEILFAGLDDVEKLKSIFGITAIWIEEASEIEPGDFNQLDIRLRGQTKHYKQIILTFNPVSITHWLKTRFFDKIDPKSTVLETTYKDNKFLDEEAISVLEAFKDKDPYYYMVYCLGEWGVLGKTVFNARIVTERLLYLKAHNPVKKQGYFVFLYKDEKIVDESIKWVEDETGPIRIFEDVKPFYPYVLGGDTAGEGSDHFAGHVLDNTNGKQVAVLRQEVDEDLFARQCYCLGIYYNLALIGLETNFSTYPVKELERLNYSRQYMREKLDSITGEIRKSFGFQTNKVSRPLIIAELVQIVREDSGTVNCIITLDEMLTFIRNEKTGKPEAQGGKTDDCVMALAIAHFIRSQQSMAVNKVAKVDIEDIDEDDRPQSTYWD